MTKVVLKVLSVMAVLSLTAILAGCQTITANHAKLSARVLQVCGYQPTIAELNLIGGALAGGPLGGAAASAVNAGEAAGCAALAASH